MVPDGVTEGAHLAVDGEEFDVAANGGTWRLSWHPSAAPDGTRHGAQGICLTADGDLVLISDDGERSGVPGGRPEGDETWEQTFRREMLEEACAAVVDAELLGFSRGACLSGPENGLVLVRAWWRAEVALGAWVPRHEIPHRRVVPSRDWPAYVWIHEGFEPLYYRAFKEAGLY